MALEDPVAAASRATRRGEPVEAEAASALPTASPERSPQEPAEAPPEAHPREGCLSEAQSAISCLQRRLLFR